MRECLVCGHRADEVRALHYFPTNLERSKQWQEAMGMCYVGTNLAKSQICSRHFEERCYRHSQSKFLNCRASPSLNAMVPTTATPSPRACPRFPLATSTPPSQNKDILLAAEDVPSDAESETSQVTSLNSMVSTKMPPLAPIVPTKAPSVNSVVSTKTPSLNLVVPKKTPPLNSMVSTEMPSLTPIMPTNTFSLNSMVSTKTPSSISTVPTKVLHISVEKTGNENFDDSRGANGKVGLKKRNRNRLDLGIPSARLPIANEVVLIVGEEDVTKKKEDDLKAVLQNLNNRLPDDSTDTQNQCGLGQQKIIIITQHNGKNNSDVSNPVQNTVNDAHAVKISHRLCQICLQLKEDTILSRLDDNKNCKYIETVMEMLKIAIPEFDVIKYSNSEICTNCKDLVIASFELKLIWKASEAKLKDFVKTYERKGKDNFMIGKIDDAIDTVNVTATISTPEPMKLVENPFEDNTEVPIPIKNMVGTPPKRNKKKAVYRSILCEQCGVTVLNKRRMVRHLKLYHLNLMCESCGEVFNSYITLNKHIRAKHRTVKRKLKTNRCNICTKVFGSVYSLKKHILHIHLKKYNYTQCHICGKRFSHITGLNAHLKLVHLSYKPHRCEICNKAFYAPSMIKKHMRTHANTVYCCNTCGKKVKYKHSLERHIKIFHLGEGGFICDICERPFWKKFDLARHKVKVHRWHPSHDKQRDS